HPQLFDTTTVFENLPSDPSGSVGIGDPSTELEITVREDSSATGVMHYPLSLTVVPGEELQLHLSYRPELFSRSAVEQLGVRLRHLLDTVVGSPGTVVGQVDLLTAKERHELVHAWNDTEREIPGSDVTGLFEASAARFPTRPAVLCQGRELSYTELDERSNRLARALVVRGAGPEKLVAVAVPRSADLLVTLLAVLKSGAGYVPLDSDYPEDRLRYMLEDARPALLVTVRETSNAVPRTGVERLLLDAPETVRELADTPAAGLSDAERAGAVAGAHPAYVIYTSGSTGRPKGVVVPRTALLNLLLAVADGVPVTSADRMLAVTTIAFDIAALELFTPLLAGGSLVLADGDMVRDPEALAAEVVRSGVTMMQATPSLWQELVSAVPDGLRNLRALTGGEALPERLATTLAELCEGGVVNLYGPTETTVWSTMAPVDGGPPVIGRPVWNTRAYVLDAALRPVPPGVAGELYISGAGVTRGYAGRPGLTAERFVADPFGAPGGRMYRTGDLVRWNQGGDLEYLSRVDQQMKVLGFRIEPGEIESRLDAHPAVRQAAVLARRDGPGPVRLVAYVVTTSGAEQPEPELLRSHLSATLPDYMVPTAFVPMEALPLTPNGKLDRSALPAPEFNGVPVGREPRNALEEKLCSVFAEVLEVDRVGIDDGFFSLGGDSITSIRLSVRARQAGLEFTSREVFRHSTVAELAHHVRVLGSSSSGSADRASVTPHVALDSGERDSLAAQASEYEAVWPLSPLQSG
ncbi:amino acid adenylation domain-containing protein, partial [Streptomyces sodiiphilus]|uniref:non-ribosomal peptide synthetase n=1 Tax=Streptomyces sodiiphilus TaxID=226217 RepID=UPI0031E3CD73